MRDISTALTLVGAIAAWYFVIAYWAFTRGDWRRTPSGWHIMLLTTDVAALLTLILAARLWPTYPGRPVITLVFYAALVGQLIYQCVLLHRVQRQPSARRRR